MSKMTSHLFYLVAPNMPTVLQAAIDAGLIPKGSSSIPLDSGDLDDNAEWVPDEAVMAARGIEITDEIRAMIKPYVINFQIHENPMWHTGDFETIEDGSPQPVLEPSGVVCVNLKVYNLPDMAAQLLTAQLAPLLMDRETLEAQRKYTPTSSATFEVTR